MRWQLKSGVENPSGITKMCPPGATVSVFFPLLPWLLPFWSLPETCHLFFWEWGVGGWRGRKRNSGVAHIWSNLFPALRSNSIHRTSSSFARLHLAISASYKLSRFALETPPRLVRLHRGERTSSYPSPLHYQRSHYTLVIKIATCPPPFLLVFFFHHSISLYQRTSGANVLADTFTPPGLEWIIVRQGSRVT